MKYKCLECGRIFSEPEDYVLSCITCDENCEHNTTKLGCPWCGPQANIVETENPYGAIIHNTAIIEISYDDIGEGTTIWHWTHIMPGVKIGKNCMIGDHVFIGNNVKIGDNVRIQNNVYIPEGVEIEDYVFIGPGVTFTNTKYPTAEFPTRPEEYQKTCVCEHTTIGAGAVILPGVVLGIDCIIGAGAVVTKDVNIAVTVVGNPAKEIER